MAESGSEQAERKARMAQAFIQAIPHSRELGMELREIGAGVAEMCVPYDPRFVGDPATGVLHGGVLTALLDSCSGAAVMSHPAAPAGTATIDLRIDYMRAAEVGATIVARAECYRVTRNVAFVRATCFTDDPDHPVATSAGAFTVERPSGVTEDGP
ncbi:MAG: PaaI family thioesterase [Pseudomonadota bacterium]